jgi:hypothetical protein
MPSIPLSTNQNLIEMSITAWIFPTETPSAHGYNVVTLSQNNGIRFRLDTANRIWVYYYNGTANFSLTSTVIQINKWTHVSVTLRSGELSIYIDGIKNNTSSASPIVFISSTGTGMVGQYSLGAETWRGYLNDIRIYDHGLTDMEIQELARAKILHYTFDDMQEPTTNYWTRHTTSPIGCVVEEVDETKNYLRIRINATSGAAHERHSTAPFPSTTGTLSFRARVINMDEVVFQPYLSGRSSSADAGPSVTVGKNWKYIHYTLNQASLETGWTRATFYMSNASIYNGAIIEFEGMQVESKSYPTEFINGSRTGKINDYSGFFNHSQNLTETNTPRWTPEAKIGTGAYHFRSSDSKTYFEGPTNLMQTFKDFSVSAWIKLDSAPTDTNLGYVIAQQYGGGGWILSVRGTDSKLQFRHHRDTANGFTTAYNLLSTFSLQTNTWYHITARDNGSVAKIYINGVENNSFTITSIIPGPSSQFFRVGAFSTSGHAHFDGTIDDLRLYSTTLSDKDIKDLYEARAEIEESGVLYARDFLSNAEETKNLIVNGNPDSTLYYSVSPNSGSGDIISFSLITNDGFINNKSIEFYFQNKVSWGYSNHNMFQYAGSGWFDTTKQYTLSMYMRKIEGNGLAQVSIRDGGSAFIVSPGWLVMDLATNTGWARYSMTFTPAITGTNPILFFSAPTGSRFRVSGIQLEQKSAATPFINGFRPAIDLPSTLDFAGDEVHETGTANFEDFSTLGIGDGLIAYWTFDGNTTDYSGRNYHCTDFSVGSEPIIHSNNIQFQAGDGLKSENILTEIDRKPFTIVILTEVTTHNSSARLAMGYPDNTLELNIRSTYSGITLRDSGGYRSANFTDTIPTGIPFLYTGTFDGSSLKYYHDGELKAEYTGHLNNVQIGTSLLFANWTTLTQSFVGRIYYAKIFNRVLSAEEVKIEYNTMVKNEVQVSESGTLYAKDLKQY